MTPLVEVDVERHTDYWRQPGQYAYLRVGPFSFAVNTADGYRIAFAITLRGHRWGWHVESTDDE